MLWSPDSEVIVIGPPTMGPGTFSPIWWSASDLSFTRTTGDVVKEVDPEFSYVYDAGGHWPGYFEGNFPVQDGNASEFTRGISSEAQRLEVVSESLASTRFDRPLALRLAFQLIGPENSVLRESGPIFWLPGLLEDSDSSAVDLILRRRYGIGIQAEAPPWVADFSLPKLDPLEAEVERLEEGLRQTQADLASAKRQSSEESPRFRRLLYESGEEGLEPIVREA